MAACPPAANSFAGCSPAAPAVPAAPAWRFPPYFVKLNQAASAPRRISAALVDTALVTLSWRRYRGSSRCPGSGGGGALVGGSGGDEGL